jgi:hypothetical protein
MVAVVAHPPAGVNVYRVVAMLFKAGAHVPTIASNEEVGNGLKVVPEQIGATWVKVGVTTGLTTIVIVAVVAHPPVGVNVYSVVFMLSNAGAHVPTIASNEEVGKGLKVAPAQIGSTWVKVGVPKGLTTIVIVAVVAQRPVVGVNVYRVVFMLSKAGAHVPVTPLFEVVGNGAKVAPAQIGSTWVNTGAVGEVTTIVMVAVVAQRPVVGVNVYSVVAMLLIPGAHVPVTPLFEVVGNGAKVAPSQIGSTWVNTGTVG